eukprot:TRINITY_DN2614_c0_g2_i2.p1 TRINITY_DN2614_c0_g2~~TRINITY_DN2614_c0_g2_i2.p1  ORF type:complete len:132 (+),score=65.48 TRINITY_DN2614_c0_g2_i2:676-1071(+)
MPKPFPKQNQPAFLPHTLNYLCDHLKTSLHDLAIVTTKNSRAFFGLPTLAFNGKLTEGFLSYTPKPPTTTPKQTPTPGGGDGGVGGGVGEGAAKPKAAAKKAAPKAAPKKAAGGGKKKKKAYPKKKAGAKK